jgi:hypothetical protein
MIRFLEGWAGLRQLFIRAGRRRFGSRIAVISSADRLQSGILITGRTARRQFDSSAKKYFSECGFGGA